MSHIPYRIFIDGSAIVCNVYRTETNPERIVHSFVEARSFTDFTRMIKVLGVPTFISFGDGLRGKKTTYDSARWLVRWCEKHRELIPRFAVHTKNGNIKSDIDYFLGFHAKRLRAILDPDIRKKDMMAGKGRRASGFDLGVSQVDELFMLNDGVEDASGEV